ncbi:hypothetical protein GCM10009647_078800 [Streptomyces sanglieri]
MAELMEAMAPFVDRGVPAGMVSGRLRARVPAPSARAVTRTCVPACARFVGPACAAREPRPYPGSVLRTGT